MHTKEQEEGIKVFADEQKKKANALHDEMPFINEVKGKCRILLMARNTRQEIALQKKVSSVCTDI